MATAQQHAAFTPEEAQRFAALMAGFEIGNASEPEAVGKGRLLRRMADEKNIRLVDAFELPEIRLALDAQMQPVRQAGTDTLALQKEVEELKRKLAVAVPKVRELAEELAKAQDWGDVFFAIYFLVSIVLGSFGLGLCLFQHDWKDGSLCAGGAIFSALFIWKGSFFERIVMNHWENVKDKILLVYEWASRICFGLNALTYIVCCVVAGGPVGPVAYIAWLYHCCQWPAVIHG